MNITIHRGTHQIGGCICEIAAGNSKVFIDFGEDLPGGEAAPQGRIPGLTVADGSASALFFTHYHGDHVGRLREVRAELPIYMGATAKALYRNYAERTKSEILGRIDSIRSFFPLQTIRVGDIAVTPLMVDHSAFDAYMFVIEAEGKRILHTGDFRLHGFRGPKTLPMLRKYAVKDGVDCMICETTNLTRADAPILTERALQDRAREILRENKYVFLLCSSTNIDRIGAFYHATPHGRFFLCDEYQKSQLETVRKYHGRHSRFYDFAKVYDYAPNLDALMEARGFCMVVRRGEPFASLLRRYKGRSKVVYSMWSGYLKGNGRNEELAALLQGQDTVFLHTSGHASPEDLLKLYDTVRPKKGVIPIHGEAPEALSRLLPAGTLLLPKDGETLSI